MSGLRNYYGRQRIELRPDNLVLQRLVVFVLPRQFIESQTLEVAAYLKYHIDLI